MSTEPRGSLFNDRDGRLLLIAQALDSAAIGIAGVALPWFVLSKGGSAGLGGLVYSLTIVPYVIFGLPAGAAGDRLPWRTVVGLSHAVQALVASVIPIWALAGAPPISVALLAAFAIGSARVFADAAVFGAIASVVGPKDFVRGQSVLSAAWSVGTFAGPAGAGALIALVGPGRALAAEAAVFVIAALLLLAVRRGPTRSGVADNGASAGLRQGLRFIASDAPARRYTLVSIASSFATAGAYGLQIPLLRNAVGLSASRTGLVLAAGAIIGTVSALSVASLDRRFGTATLCTIGLIVTPAVLVALATAQVLTTALLAVCAQAALTWGLSTLFISARQRRASAELQSRVGISGRMLLLGSVTAGATLASSLAGPLSTRTVYLAMAGASGVVALVAIPAINRLVEHDPGPALD